MEATIPGSFILFMKGFAAGDGPEANTAMFANTRRPKVRWFWGLFRDLRLTIAGIAALQTWNIVFPAKPSTFMIVERVPLQV